MKIVFLVYHDILDDRINTLLADSGIDYYTQWEDVKGKGHKTDAHLGSRTFPGFNFVRMIALTDEASLPGLIERIEKMNASAIRPDDKVRLFQMPLEKIV